MHISQLFNNEKYERMPADLKKNISKFVDMGTETCEGIELCYYGIDRGKIQLYYAKLVNTIRNNLEGELCPWILKHLEASHASFQVTMMENEVNFK